MPGRERLFEPLLRSPSALRCSRSSFPTFLVFLAGPYRPFIVPRRRCPEAPLSRGAVVPRRRCPETPLSRDAVVPRRRCPERRASRAAVPEPPSPWSDLGFARLPDTSLKTRRPERAVFSALSRSSRIPACAQRLASPLYDSSRLGRSHFTRCGRSATCCPTARACA
jgi:hypothetical protein